MSSRCCRSIAALIFAERECYELAERFYRFAAGLPGSSRRIRRHQRCRFRASDRASVAEGIRTEICAGCVEGGGVS